MKTALIRMSIAFASAAMLAGCAGVMAHKGAVIDPQLATGIQPGVDNKASVEKLLGRPTFTGQFSQNDWYYLSRDTKQVAFRNPRVQRQSVLLVSFDQAGNVASVNRTGKEYVAGLDPSNRKTPTLGRQRSFFDELFGNIGQMGMPGATPGGY
jgi:outer membrane protein assembly factor BamE (lipoprotein component of BamABCDE complex)